MAKIKYRWAKDPEDYLLQRVEKKGEGECWLWQSSVDRDGYGQCHASPQAQKLQVTRAHQMAYVVWKGPIPEGMLVCHTCDNPTCCNPNHLFLGTNFDNVQDMMQKGRYINGSTKKFDHEAILSLHGEKPCEQVAEMYGCSYSLVCQIWRANGKRGKLFHGNRKIK